MNLYGLWYVQSPLILKELMAQIFILIHLSQGCWGAVETVLKGYSLLGPVARRAQGQPEKATTAYRILEELLPVGTGVLANFSDPCRVF